MGNLLSSSTPSAVNNQPRDPRHVSYPYCGCEDCDHPIGWDGPLIMNTTQFDGHGYFAIRRSNSPTVSSNQNTGLASLTSTTTRTPIAPRLPEPRTQLQIIRPALDNMSSRGSISANNSRPTQSVRTLNISPIPSRVNASTPRRRQPLPRGSATRSQITPQRSQRDHVAPLNPARIPTSSSPSSTIRSADRRIVEISRTNVPSTSSSIPTAQSSIYQTTSKVNQPSTSSNATKPGVASTRKETWPSYLFEESVDEVSNMLECSICLDLCSGKIRHGKNGHNICETHTSQISICPICRISYHDGSSRNLLAEKLVVQKKSKLEMKEQQQKLLDDMEKLKVTKKVTTTRNIKPPEPDKPCGYVGDGCVYTGDVTRLLAHQPVCDFRPIECFFKTDGCQNAQIPFAGYLEHLKTVRKVRTFGGRAHVKFYVNRSGKLVRDGSSSMAIISGPYGIDNFILRAIQSDDDVIIWIAIHENPQRAYRFKAELELDDHGNVNPLYQRYNFVLSTTRDINPAHYLTIPVDYLEANLRLEKTSRGKYAREYWAVTTRITYRDDF
ncbi:uncharacterized protein LOC118436922 isoform X1 [Folsomia candida]|uniref:uncharacterized protein LOC118436922 isoform X1 n=1 Tax=Folsomia candida TaxID=158441 RepID=UPI00160510DD|nr:uncharacterized protein LOC118436922 isoform X1 [Folsomia candida]